MAALFLVIVVFSSSTSANPVCKCEEQSEDSSSKKVCLFSVYSRLLMTTPRKFMHPLRQLHSYENQRLPHTRIIWEYVHCKLIYQSTFFYKVVDFNVHISEAGEKYNEKIEVDPDKQTELFEVPAHPGVDRSDVLHDFKQVRFILKPFT